MATTTSTEEATIRSQMAAIRQRLTTASQHERLALEEEYEDLRQDLIELIHY